MTALAIILHHSLAVLLIGGAIVLHLLGKTPGSTAAAGTLLTLAGLVVGRLLPQPRADDAQTRSDDTQPKGASER